MVGRPEREALRAALRARFPWVTDTELGPSAVAAGECDACGREPRLIAPCGPPPRATAGRLGPDWAVGRRCAARLGDALWCEGHADEAAVLLARMAVLGAHADTVARLWWVATGEIRLDPALRRQARELALTV